MVADRPELGSSWRSRAKRKRQAVAARNVVYSKFTRPADFKPLVAAFPPLAFIARSKSQSPDAAMAPTLQHSI